MFIQLKKLLLILLFILPSGGAGAVSEISTTPIVMGELVTIHSEILGEDRQLQIYIPDNYQFRTKTYPVIYTFDGDFLFQTLATITAHRSSRDLMPESIVVGIPNNSGKRLEMALPLSREAGGQTNFGGKTDDYLSFLNDEIFPYIENNYRTAPHRTIIGMSPTVGPVYSSFWHRPDMFNAYIAIAANLRTYLPTGETLSQKIITELQNNQRPETKFYLSRGGLDIASNNELAEAYRAFGEEISLINTPKVDFKLEILEGEEHYGSGLPAIYNALEFIYPLDQWRPDYLTIREADDPAGELKAFYDNLSQVYGFDVTPIETGYWMGFTIMGSGRALMRQQRIDDAIKWYQLALTYYPSSPWLNSSLVTAYMENQQLSLAIKYAERTVELAREQGNEALPIFQDELDSLKAM